MKSNYDDNLGDEARDDKFFTLEIFPFYQLFIPQLIRRHPERNCNDGGSTEAGIPK